ncbi:Large ribosomal subunit protein uL22-like protein [Drosera capensis]
MRWWQGHLKALIRNVGGTLEHNLGRNCSSRNAHTGSLRSIGESRALKLPSTDIPTPFYHIVQQFRISTTRKLLADSSSDATPISSPLTPLLTSGSGEARNQAVIAKPDKVQAVLKGINQSPKKVNLVAALVRGMRVEDALIQMQLTVKRAAKTVYQVIHSARANATHNHGLDADRLLVAEAYVGKGFFKKRISYHAKGRHGIMEKPECRLTVVVREMTTEEEAEIARLKVNRYRKLTKRERRLVPHKIIETTPIWGRKNMPRHEMT